MSREGGGGDRPSSSRPCVSGDAGWPLVVLLFRLRGGRCRLQPQLRSALCPGGDLLASEPGRRACLRSLELFLPSVSFIFPPSLFIHPVPSSTSTVPHCCPCLYFCSLVSLEEKDARCTFTSQELCYLIGTEPYFYLLYQVVYSCVKYVRAPPGWAPAVLHSSLPFLIPDFSFR